MNRFTQLDPGLATGKTLQLFDRVHSKIGIIPNLCRVLGTSPAALEGYLNFEDALARGILNSKVREQIALAVAESNMCGYCLSAHTFLANKFGLTEKEITDARHATAETAETDAILKLSRSIVVQRGEINDADLKEARAGGLTDHEIVETVANVALNIFTNYVNHVARTVVDFAEVKPGNFKPQNGSFASIKLESKTTMFRTNKIGLIAVLLAVALPLAARAQSTTPIQTGTFHGQVHSTSGRTAIYQGADGKRILRLTKFKTSNGPDVHVILIAAKDAKDDDNFLKSNVERVEIGKLKGNEGDQNYEIPAGTDLSKFRTVVIYCERFNATFGAAPLEKF
jgi:uncharacterized peroxidase-related enzyme